MSSETSALHRYRLVTALLLSALAIAALVLALFNLGQGPRLVSSRVDPVLVAEQAGQTLVLQSDQPLGAVTAADVTVAPTTRFEVEYDGDRVTVQFSEPLRYATEYAVHAEVRRAHTGASSELHASFTTEDPHVAVLQRDLGGEDRIEQQRLVSGTDRRTLFATAEIQEYAMLSNQLLAVASDPAGHPTVGAVEPGTDDLVPFVSGDLDAITQLRAEPQTRMAGYLLAGTDFGGERFSGYLLLQDLRFSEGGSTEVLGPTLQPLEVADWRFEPGSASVIIRDTAGGHFRFTPLSGDVAAKPIAAQEAEEAEGPDPLHTAEHAIGRVNASGDPAEIGTPGTRVLVTDAAGTRQLFAPASERSRIGRICASPNSEFISVEVTSVEGEPDGYADEPGFTHTTTSFVRVADGEVVSSMNGMLASWCR